MGVQRVDISAMGQGCVEMPKDATGREWFGAAASKKVGKNRVARKSVAALGGRCYPWAYILYLIYAYADFSYQTLSSPTSS